MAVTHPLSRIVGSIPIRPIMTYELETDKGFVSTGRCAGIPRITIEAAAFPDNRDAKFIYRFSHFRFDISPDEAIALAESLLKLAEDCKLNPDLRKKKNEPKQSD